MARRVEVHLVGDSRSLERAYDRAGKKGQEFERSFSASLKSLTKAGLVGAAVAGTALLTKGLVSSVKAAKEAEIAETGLRQALKQSGNSYKQYGKQIDNAIQKTSKLAAIDDEELSTVFSQLVRTTGSVTKATKGMAIAANIARARNVPLATAAKAVERAFLGSETGLRRFGITVPKVTKSVDALKTAKEQLKDKLGDATDAQRRELESQIDAIDAQMKAAAAQDKTVQGLNAIDKAQRKFAGSGEAYAKTFAGAQDRFAVATENLQESIGKHLLPVLTKLFIKGVEWIEWAEQNWPRFAAKVREMWQEVKPILDGFIEYIDGWVKIIKGVIEGDWGLIWKGLKQVVRTGFELVYEYLKAVPLRFFKFGIDIGKQLGEGIVQGLKDSTGDLFKSIIPDLPRFPKIVVGGGGSSQPKRAVGGSVRPGVSYTVGERGPETLTMGHMGGTISPSGGGVSIGVVHVHGVQNVAELIQEIQRVARHQGSSQRGAYGGQSLAFN